MIIRPDEQFGGNFKKLVERSEGEQEMKRVGALYYVFRIYLRNISQSYPPDKIPGWLSL